MQITSAMKMVSAAKLKKAQDAITAMRPYAEKMELLQNLSATLDGDVGGGIQRNVVKSISCLRSSNRGLCGAFNSNVIKASKSRSGLCRKTSRCFCNG
jgi:F-type H+-transporting ATPase subunit gamma